MNRIRQAGDLELFVGYMGILCDGDRMNRDWCATMLREVFEVGELIAMHAALRAAKLAAQAEARSGMPGGSRALLQS